MHTHIEKIVLLPPGDNGKNAVLLKNSNSAIVQEQDILEQCIFSMYLSVLGVRLEEYNQKLVMSAFSAGVRNPVIRMAGEALQRINKGESPELSMDWINEVIRFFTLKGDDIDQKVTITENFIMQMVPLLNIIYEPGELSNYPDKTIYSPMFYAVYQNCGQMAVIPGADGRSTRLARVISICSVPVKDSYSLENRCTDAEYGFKLLRQFVSIADEPENIIALLAGLSIPSMQYDMKSDSSIRKYQTFYAICAGMVYKREVDRHLKPTDVAPVISTFMTEIHRQISTCNGKKIVDSKLFAKFIKILRLAGYAEQELVNYCTKPVNRITATEALAYRNAGMFTDILTDRLLAGMEDNQDDDASEEQENPEAEGDDSDAANDTNSEGSDTESEGDSTEGDNAQTDDAGTEGDDPDEGGEPLGANGDNSLNPPEENKENLKPKIDPAMMLLELANPSESLSDYLYRSLVSRRISALLRNPPENAKPNDLVLLKRYRAGWLYLVSIPCLREFLARLSLRLSD